MDEVEKKILQRLKDDYSHYASRCLKIRTKSGEVKPFVLNRSQSYLHDIVEDQRRRRGKVRVIIVKGRQQGISTYIEGRFYWRVTNSFGMRAFILTHDKEATNNLFDMAKRYHENCPHLVRPSIQASNSKELIFGDLDSGYKIGTAGNKAVGRSSTIQLLHGSEVAYYPHANEHAKGIMQAVPNESGTEIFLESTANGVSNYFHEQWQLAQSGRSDFIPVFIPWFWETGYMSPCNEDFSLTQEEKELVRIYNLTNEQLNWRRYKIVELSASGADGEQSFLSEYPCCSTEAFQRVKDKILIKPLLAMRAAKGKAEEYGKLIVGVDPARGGDKTAIIRRKGRVAYGLESSKTDDTMEIVGRVHNIILNESPFRVCIDIGGLGAGVYDRLIELGHSRTLVKCVNFGESALDRRQYYNKRAEMWGKMKLWLMQEPVQIPDNDELVSDLCAPQYKIHSDGSLILQKKEELQRSPDTADALALTFAVEETELLEEKEKSNTIVSDMANEMQRINRVRYGY